MREGVDRVRAQGWLNLYLVVSQTLSSEPGPFTLSVEGLPASRERRARGRHADRALPQRSRARRSAPREEPTDPSCIDGENTVWYRLDRAAGGGMAVYLESSKSLATAACVVEAVRGKPLSAVTDRLVTGSKGTASVGFEARYAARPTTSSRARGRRRKPAPSR